MRNNSVIGGKTLLAMAMAAGALVSSASFAASTAQSQTLDLGNKKSAGCVRFFVEGTHDVDAGHEYYTNNFKFGKAYMASVFKGKCGGAALRNVWFTPARQKGSVIYWDVN